jgi:hypothetical protein
VALCLGEDLWAGCRRPFESIGVGVPPLLRTLLTARQEDCSCGSSVALRLREEAETASGSLGDCIVSIELGL